MLLIPCVHCGPRNVSEFAYADAVLPAPDPNAAPPSVWRRYLYMRTNPAGWTSEWWYHQSGCRRYFMVERDTRTNEIRAAALPPRPADRGAP
ncbi:MAG: sarcosine oxidase subunit delta [Chloroflexi bacterium]|nr:sarcosine oxidase subunit delta [Chloroflexota bacterium]